MVMILSGDKSTSPIMVSDMTGLITEYQVSTEARLLSRTSDREEKTDPSGVAHLAFAE